MEEQAFTDTDNLYTYSKGLSDAVLTRIEPRSPLLQDHTYSRPQDVQPFFGQDVQPFFRSSTDYYGIFSTVGQDTELTVAGIKTVLVQTKEGRKDIKRMFGRIQAASFKPIPRNKCKRKRATDRKKVVLRKKEAARRAGAAVILYRRLLGAANRGQRLIEKMSTRLLTQ